MIVKETGCGISAKVGRQLERAGVRYVDVSGAGGTSWVRVEDLRGDARSHALGQLFRDWGIPTAASLVQLRGSGLVRIASGGIRNALDAAKALALGAEICGFALPVFRAYRNGGLDAATSFLEQAIEGLRVAMVLTGSRTLDDLRRSNGSCIGPRLERWIHEGGMMMTSRIPGFHRLSREARLEQLAAIGRSRRGRAPTAAARRSRSTWPRPTA